VSTVLPLTVTVADVSSVVFVVVRPAPRARQTMRRRLRLRPRWVSRWSPVCIYATV